MSNTRIVAMTPFCLLLLLFASTSAEARLGEKVQYFPQFAIGGGATSSFSVHNPGSTTAVVNLEFFSSDGDPFLTDQVEVAPRATRTVNFGGQVGDTSNGWAKLSSNEQFVATLFYRIAQLGNVGVLPATGARTQTIFTFTQDGTRTGLALANPDESDPAVIQVRFYDGEGTFLGQTSMTLQPRGHRALFLDEPPYNLDVNGSAELLSSIPIVAVTLRLDRGLLASTPVVTPKIAGGIVGYERISHGEDFSGMFPGGCGSFHATCPEGKVVTGGSAQIAWMPAGDRPNTRLYDYPTGDRTWSATLCNDNNRNIDGGIILHLVCVSAGEMN